MHPAVEILVHLMEHGCYNCGEKPTPATIRKFVSEVKCTADGEFDSMKHICHRCRVMEN